MWLSTGSERLRIVLTVTADGSEGTGIGVLAAGLGCRRLLGGGATGAVAVVVVGAGSGDGWRRRAGAAWDALRCCWGRLPWLRPRTSGAWGAADSAGAGLGEREAGCCCCLGLGELLWSVFGVLCGLERERRPGVRVGWTWTMG